MRRFVLIACSLLLGGCAATHSKAPSLGRSDTSGFDARGASVNVDYRFQTSGISADFVSYSVAQSASESTISKLREARVTEVKALLDGYGFRAVSQPTADYTVRVIEGGEVTEPDSVGLLLLSSFSMLTIPASFTATRGYTYELWSKGQKLHSIETKTEKKQLFGLIGLPLLAINVGGSGIAALASARITAC